MEYVPLLQLQIANSFGVETLKKLLSSEYASAFSHFLSLINQTYVDVEKQRSIVTALAEKTAKVEERLVRFECCVHHSKDIITITRLDGLSIYSSPAVLVELGYNPALFMSGDRFDTEMVHQDDLPTLVAARNNILESKEPQLIQYRVKQFVNPNRNMKPKSQSPAPSTARSVTSLSSSSMVHSYPATSSRYVWLESSFRLVSHRNVVVMVSRIIPVDTFMGKLRTVEDRLRMTEHILRKVRVFLDDKFGQNHGKSPRTSEEWTSWLQRFRHSNRLMNMFDDQDVIQVMDSRGRYVYVSPACEQLTGYAPEELIGKSYTETVHPDDKKLTECLPENNGELQTKVIRRMQKDGTYKWIEQTGFVYKENMNEVEESAFKSMPGRVPKINLSTIPESRATSPLPDDEKSEWAQICIERNVTAAEPMKQGRNSRNNTMFISVMKDAKIAYMSPDACNLLRVSLEVVKTRLFYDLLPSKYHLPFSRVLMLPDGSSCDVYSHLVLPNTSEEKSFLQPVWMECAVKKDELIICLHVSSPPITSIENSVPTLHSSSSLSSNSPVV